MDERLLDNALFTYICALIQNEMAVKSYKQIESSGTKAEEPVVAYQQAIYTLTDSEQKLIMQAEQDVEAGRIYTQAQVDKMVEAWLH